MSDRSEPTCDYIARAMADGVLLTAHGSIENLDELPDFLARIRHGRPPSAALVDDVARRYRSIGGSPLLATTREVARLLERELGLPVELGMRLSRPEIGEGLAALRARGVSRVLSLPLAPQSVHVYHAAVREVVGDLALVEAAPWGRSPALLAGLSEKIDDALAALPPHLRDEAPLILTAHSLPVRAIRAGDPYEAQLRELCDALVSSRGERRRVTVAFQSQGADGGEWLGPELHACLRELAEGDARAVVVSAVGFLAEHVETLYDLDIEARWIAEGLGLRFVRSRCLDAAPALIRALAAVARHELAR